MASDTWHRRTVCLYTVRSSPGRLLHALVLHFSLACALAVPANPVGDGLRHIQSRLVCARCPRCAPAAGGCGHYFGTCRGGAWRRLRVPYPLSGTAAGVERAESGVAQLCSTAQTCIPRC